MAAFVLLVSIFAVFVYATLSQSLSLNITRGEIDVIGILPDCSYCGNFKQAACSFGSTQCQCSQSYSTFLIHNFTCVSASALIKENSCLSRQDGKIDFLEVVNLTSASRMLYKYPGNSTCTVQKVCHLTQIGDWECSVSPDFRVVDGSQGTKRFSIQVSGSSDHFEESFSGKIMRVDLSCNTSASESSEKDSCILLKVKGSKNAKYLITTGKPNQHKSTTRNNEPEFEATTTTKSKSFSNFVGVTSEPQRSTRPSAKLDLTKITLDNEEDNKEVMVATIAVIGAVVCVLIICVFTWIIIKYRHRFRRRDENGTPGSNATVNDTQCQSVIPLSMVTVPDPVYSELPDIIESTNNGLTSSTPTLNDVTQDFFMNRNPALYNTLPKARQNTDPLPVPPKLRPRPRTPEPRMMYRANTCAENTNTARFLSQVGRNKCMSLDRFATKPRERSSTDVDLLDDVFCQDFHGLEVLGKRLVWSDDDGDDDDDNDAVDDDESRDRSESFYEDLNADIARKTAIYESLHNATKESPKTRLSTLERIQQQNHFDNDGFTLQDEKEPEYHVLEPLTNQEVTSILAYDNDGLADDGEGSLPHDHEYQILENSVQTNFNDGLCSSDTNITSKYRRELQKSFSESSLYRLRRVIKDGNEIFDEHDKAVFLEKNDLRRQRSRSFHG